MWVRVPLLPLKEYIQQNKKQQTLNLSEKCILFLEAPIGVVCYLESSEVNFDVKVQFFLSPLKIWKFTQAVSRGQFAKLLGR